MKAWVLIACVVSVWLSQAPTISPLIRSPDLREWLTLAAEHQPGVEDAPLKKVAGWSGTKLLRTLGLAQSEISTQALNDLLERAALLHGDAMMLRSETNPPWRDTSEVGGSSILAQDGQRLGNRSLDPHIQFARKIFRAMREPMNSSKKRSPEPWEVQHRRNPRIHQWFRAVSSELAGRLWLADLRPHLEDARRALDDTAGTMFDSACFSEAIASAQVQRAIPSRPHYASDVLLDEGVNLAEAERYYRAALKLDPGYADARVRLARVLSLRDQSADAFALLQRPLEGADPFVRYFGALALGAAAEATQKPEVARAAYERALELFPKAQSPLLALIRLARERADDGMARDLAARFALLGPNEHYRLDPWWDYFDCNGRNRKQELERLWSLYRKQESQ